MVKRTRKAANKDDANLTHTNATLEGVTVCTDDEVESQERSRIHKEKIGKFQEEMERERRKKESAAASGKRFEQKAIFREKQAILELKKRSSQLSSSNATFKNTFNILVKHSLSGTVQGSITSQTAQIHYYHHPIAMHQEELKQTSAQYIKAVHDLHKSTSGLITESKHIGDSWDYSIEAVKDSLESLKSVTHDGIARAIGFKVENKEDKNLDEKDLVGDDVNWRQGAHIFKKSMLYCTKDLPRIAFDV